MTLTPEETSHIYLCITVVSDVTPPAGFRGVTLTIVTRTSSSQSSNIHFSFICAGAVSNMLRVSESVLCNHANKHRSGCPLGTRCPPPASQHGSHWGHSCVEPNKPPESSQLHAVTRRETSKALHDVSQVMFRLYRTHGPAEPRQFPLADSSNSRRPHRCLFRQ